MKKTLVICLCSLPIAFGSFLAVIAKDAGQQRSSKPNARLPQIAKPNLQKLNPQIDYRGFSDLTQDTAAYRDARRVSTKKFKEMSRDRQTIILDTRSKKAFDEAHVRGAIHLNFSDFTVEKLQKVIPNKETRILIYCNNNFVNQNQIPAFAPKMPALALNIPTFVNLVGYGYENVYELADMIDAKNSKLPLEGTSVPKPPLFSELTEFHGC